jgi:two-component system sensor histidine kinase KdpD
MSEKLRGQLRILLGYAAGVGKTYKMLEEAQQLKREGRDVVVGYFEPHGRKDTIAKIEGLEVIPRRRIEYRGRQFEEMDTPAILARHPEICAIDEFPHTNIPGSERTKRWEDVMVLLDAGISVTTTMNIQHLESLNDQMHEITGVRVRETIPDWVVKEAEEVVLIDLPPRALLNRLQRGVIYGQDKAQHALDNFFKEPALAALREMALRQTAHEVEIRQDEAAPESGNPERILIHVTESPASVAVIRRGKRVADYLKADCFAVAVLPSPDREQLDRHLEFARKLQIEARVLEGANGGSGRKASSEDAAQALVDFARRNGVTQIFLGKPSKRSIPFFGKRPLAMEIIRHAQDRQVTVVAERRHP